MSRTPPRSWLRPEIAAIQAYEPEPGGPEIRLDANESARDLPEALKAEIWESYQAQAWNRYPDPTCGKLREALAVWEGVGPEQLVAGNGSDEIIRDLLTAFAGPGAGVVFPTPTFSMYGLLAKAAGCLPLAVALQEDWTLDLEPLLSTLNQPQGRLLFLANPNNPTGTLYPRQAIEQILQATDRLVVVDEAYGLFAGESVMDLLSRYPHLMVLKTFSKAMSLAGLRIGYLAGAVELMDGVNRIRLPYNLDGFAQTAAMVALRHKPLWQERAGEIVRERARVAQALGGVPGMAVFPSAANFILVQCEDAESVKTDLANAGIAVRGFKAVPRLGDCLRITIGQPAENDRLIDRLNRR